MDINTFTDKEIDNRLRKFEERHQLLDALRLYDGVDKVIPIEQVVMRLSGEPKTRVFRSGLSRLDTVLGGFKAGELVIVSGPTGEGKTSFLQTLTHGFTEDGAKCLWFSYETGMEDFIERFGMSIPSFVLPQENVSANVKWLEQRIWEGIAKYDAKIVFVDHLHYLIDLKDLASTNSSLAIGFLMRKLKQIAISTDTIIFLVSHLRKTELEREPTIHDLRDSSFVGQESDTVLLIWRDRKMNRNDKENTDNKTSFLRVDKNRKRGELCTMKMSYNGRFYLVTNQNEPERFI